MFFYGSPMALDTGLTLFACILPPTLPPGRLSGRWCISARFGAIAGFQFDVCFLEPRLHAFFSLVASGGVLPSGEPAAIRKRKTW